MSRAVDKALSRFEPKNASTPKLNCAQSVLTGLGPQIGIDDRTAIRAGRGFGGGIGHQGDICGAVCGAVIALGFGAESDSEAENRSRASQRVQDLFRRFRERHGHVRCRLLTGIDPSTPEGESEAKARNVHHTHCRFFVRSAVEIVEDLLSEEPADDRNALEET